MQKTKEGSVITVPASRKKYKVPARTKVVIMAIKDPLCLLAKSQTSHSVAKDKSNPGKRTANSLTPKSCIEKAESQVDKGGFAQKGTP